MEEFVVFFRDYCPWTVPEHWCECPIDGKLTVKEVIVDFLESQLGMTEAAIKREEPLMYMATRGGCMLPKQSRLKDRIAIGNSNREYQ